VENPFESPDPNVMNPQEWKADNTRSRDIFFIWLHVCFGVMLIHDTCAWASNKPYSMWFYYSAFGLALFSFGMYMYYYWQKVPEEESDTEVPWTELK
jgi:phosphatidylglycerophosphate synthase